VRSKLRIRAPTQRILEPFCSLHPRERYASRDEARWVIEPEAMRGLCILLDAGTDLR
jgi:hypothetical protein